MLQSSLGMGDCDARKKKTPVLLQTARAWAEGLQKHALVRLLLDGGSQRNVSENVQIRVLGEE